MITSEVKNPHVGMLAIVRKRRAVISEVRPFLGEDSVLHLVRMEYKDDASPEFEELIWEREPHRQLLEPNALPQGSDPPMVADDFDALLSAARWTALSPYLDPDDDGPLGRMPICSPFHGAVQVEDYQLVPLLKALKMPRINLMIADDVGLGKTIEAGLILRELLIRRRIQRVLILTPASLRIQWHDEMWSKFSLRFDVIDRASTHKLKRTMGIDANPWRSSYRAISSYHYLRQPDVLEQFHSACQTPEGSPHLPWDLLIVDEVHNMMPSPFGEDSDLCKTLRYIAPHFEHRLFLTATPHNGRTRCFSGLMELLDPVRFSRTDELKSAERQRIQDVVVRRLKRDINCRTNPPKFCTRLEPKALMLTFSKTEKALIVALSTLRERIRQVIRTEGGRRKLAGTFAIEILGKRLLSGPATFANSWLRCKLGLNEDESSSDSDVEAAKKSVDDDTGDDRETERRGSTASLVIGSWLKALEDKITDEIADVDAAVEAMGIALDSDALHPLLPTSDARFDKLTELITELLLDGKKWRDYERIVIFTEYKTTLDYLLTRLRKALPDAGDRILSLFGGMHDIEREQIKEQFNDPDAKVRVLLATDAASEGLNLQDTARYLLHYDCPWNPSRIEQRNGRLDRHGQARDVQTYHFASDEDADLRFMALLIRKVDQMREDLGAVGEVLDEAMHSRLIEGQAVETVERRLDLQLETAKGKVDLPADDSVTTEWENGNIDHLQALAAEVALDEHAQRHVLDVAMGIHAGRPQLSEPDERKCCKVLNPSLSGWSDTIDETVRRTATGSGLGPMPLLTFTSDPFIHDVGGRTIFRPNHNIQMVHLGHPLMSLALNILGQRRYPGTKMSVSRWTVREGQMPAGADALILLHLEELGVNELRETFHHWIRTVRFPVKGDDIAEPLPHVPAALLDAMKPVTSSSAKERAAELLLDLEVDLKNAVRDMRERLTGELRAQLDLDGKTARSEEDRRYQSRQGEVSTLIAENTLQKLEREIASLKAQKDQGMLFDAEAHLEDLDKSIKLKEEEVEHRRKHYEEVREQLSRERERVVNRLLPKRYTLFGEAQVFPLAIEVCLPEGAHP
jgi:superfamily II DNA or RNA helicase